MPARVTELKPKELSSWKEIAYFLGVSVRTAQHWEADKGLPVKRLAGEKARVWADAAELVRWCQANLTANHRRWPRSRILNLLAAAGLGAILMAGASYLLSNRKGPPARFRHEATSLVVTDEQGRELWRKTFEQAFLPESTPEKLIEHNRAWFGDLDGDGQPEMLYVHSPVSVEKDGETLFCFSGSGQEKWRLIPGRALSTRPHTLPRTYRHVRFRLLAPGRDRTRKMVLFSAHVPRYPCQVALLSHQGAVLGEYWHSGALGEADLADLDGDGRQELLVGGISNGYGAATLLVLDPNDLGGASHEENLDYQLQGFPPGREKARLLFPRTCINRKFHPYGNTAFVGVQGDSVRVQTHERAGAIDPTVHYFLDRKLELKQVVVSDGLEDLHRELEAVGQLDHHLTDKEVAELRKIRYLKRLGP